MTDNVTQFPGTEPLPENDIQLAPRLYNYCSHESIVLDEHARTVQCANQRCGAILDPFGYLVSNAHSIQRAWQNHREVARKASETAGRVTLMLKEEQRLRSMVKRLQEKSGAVVTVRGTESK